MCKQFLLCHFDEATLSRHHFSAISTRRKRWTEAMLQVNVHALVSHLIPVAFGMFKLNTPFMHRYVCLTHPLVLGLLRRHYTPGHWAPQQLTSHIVPHQFAWSYPEIELCLLRLRSILSPSMLQGSLRCRRLHI